MGLCLSKRRCPPSLWSDLPPELGGLILCRLLSHTDRLSFRAVCRQWRLAAQDPSLPPALPWIRLDVRTFQSLPGGEQHRLNKAVVLSPTRTATPSGGWFIKYEHYNNQIRSVLVNPFTFAVIHVPPEPLGENQIHKMIVCSPNLIAAMINYTTVVGVYRPGAPSWLVSPPCYYKVGQYWQRCYSDIAFHRGKLYSLTDTKELFSHELVSGHDADKVPEVRHAVELVIKEHASVENHRSYLHYLIATCDKLLMVTWRYPLWATPTARPIKEKRDSLKLQVFEADLEMGQWLEVRGGLDGQALFASRKCSKAIHVCSSDQKFKGDHVYFLGADLGLVDSAFRSYLYGSYDLRNDRISELFLNRKGNMEGILSPEWFFPCT